MNQLHDVNGLDYEPQDPKLRTSFTERGGGFARGKKLIEKFWSGDDFVFRFLFFRGGETDSTPEDLKFRIAASDVFAFQTITVDGLKPSFWNHSRERYIINEDSIKSKWIKPSVGKYFLEKWDPLKQGVSIYIQAEEVDKGERITVNKSFKFEEIKSSEVSSSIGASMNVGVVGLKNSISARMAKKQTKTTDKKFTWSYDNESDHWGSTFLNFKRKVIYRSTKYPPIQKKGKMYYPIEPIRIGGYMEMIILPQDDTNPQVTGLAKIQKSGSITSSSVSRNRALPPHFRNVGARVPTNNWGMYTPNDRPSRLLEPNELSRKYGDNPMRGLE
ncbi:hypothetical protein K4L44_10570 [Halosquirtibacter laminarini]|uniref:Uncharacterized protein n=1 Tax=Halosquirtibacter laminarini TaxID=3374600 RepID=A0AC61NNC7_9BACT|nr:hypothetical protein K4L44_10570 [Prolixibacteraceae bacterium]